jgi:uncharacterized protein (DUF58 family)
MSYAAMRSARRGVGTDIAGSRAYRPGDNVDNIDWAASARLSAASGLDEFVVRERFADEAPWVVVLADRRPSMSVCSEDWPWLRKPEALRHAAALIGESAAAARGLLGYLDEAEGDVFWRPPRSEHLAGGLELDRPWGAPEDTLARGLAHLAQHRRDLPAGSFVFCLSDFLAQPSRDDWLRALERQWEVVPVVIQDPVWEETFPDVSGVSLRFVEPGGGTTTTVALTEREARERRKANESRRAGLLHELRALDMDPVLVSSHEHRDVASAFLAWADLRLFTRGRA